MRTIEELNKVMCEALGIDYKDFVKMNFEEQDKVRRRYTTEVSGLKYRQHK